MALRTAQSAGKLAAFTFFRLDKKYHYLSGIRI